jgi:glycosyltransferase involved in cell wall biosynthesis
MKTTLIVATYEWTEALDLVLKSVARQTQLPDEIIVADDGSGAATEALVAQWGKRLPIPVRHVWQENKGFRLARSRNRAIAAAIGDYIISVDGDLVLNQHFIEDHKRVARPGYFVQAARVLTGPATSRRMLEQGIMDLNFFAPDIKRRRHTLRNRLLSWLVMQRTRRDQRQLRGCNQAYWRQDLLRVNGFNEAMVGWGREDHELAVRLNNIGIKRKNLKFAGLAIHLYHPSRQPQGVNPNDKFLLESKRQRSTWCALGIDSHKPTADPVAIKPRLRAIG